MLDTFMTTTERATLFSLLLLLHTEHGDNLDQKQRLEIITRHNTDSRHLCYTILDRNNQNTSRMTRILEGIDRTAGSAAYSLKCSNRCDLGTPTLSRPTSFRNAAAYQYGDQSPYRGDSATSADVFAGVVLTGLAAVIAAMKK